MECEICGAETDTLYEIEIEGATMLVCSVCAKGKQLTGRIVHEGKAAEGEKSTYAPAKPSEPTEEELVDNYGAVIKSARESLGLPIKVLAEKISEKASTLLRVEEQKTLPSDKLVKKLEKELGIKLTRPVPASSASSLSKPQPLSLWDVASKKEKKG
ncbi:MAG: multiprotein bridging factor aMBF1 [Candidatus Micrarchaeia archaeon]